MRFSPAALALSVTLALVSSVSFAKTPLAPPSARAQALINKGAAEQAKGEYDVAYDYYESALISDPMSVNAYIAMAQIAEAQGLPGKAIRLYSKALTLDANNPYALAGQGRAFVAKGAMDRAKGNKAKLELTCASPCTIAESLDKAIAVGPPAPKAISVEAVTPKAEVAPAE